jgi:hypothetical protein
MITLQTFCSTRTVRNSTKILGRRFASTSPLTIKASQDELSHGRLASRNLEKAVRSLHEDGLVVIENAIPHEDLDHLNTKMVQDALHLQSRGKDMPFNYNVGNSMAFPLPPAKCIGDNTDGHSQSSKILRQRNNTSPRQSS